jgi:hypothetical protein
VESVSHRVKKGLQYVLVKEFVMAKLVKLVASPAAPPIEVVGDIVMQLHPPHPKNAVNILINPAIAEYKERLPNKNIDIRQLTVTKMTPDSKILHFDFDRDNVHTIRQGDKNYDIRLMQIRTEPFEGQNFLAYEFFVFESSVSKLMLEGCIAAWINHKDNDWATNNKLYSFAPISIRSITLMVSKTPNKLLNFNLVGPLNNEFNFTAPVPERLPKRGVFFVITWGTSKVSLYINNQLIKDIDSPPIQYSE